MKKQTKKKPAKIAATVVLAATLSLAGPAMAAQADMLRGGVASTSTRCWELRNQTVSTLQTQGYHVTSAGRCVYLNDGYWHYTVRFTELKQAA